MSKHHNPSRGDSPVNPTPPVTNPLVPQGVGRRFFNVCFQDNVLSLKGWARPRWEGCKLISLYENEFTPEMEEGKIIGPLQNRYVNNHLDNLQFAIRSGERPGFNYYIPKGPFKKTIGDIFAPASASGIATVLYDVYMSSTNWQNEFNTELDNTPWLKYPPKQPDWVWNPHINSGDGDYVLDAASNPIVNPVTSTLEKRCLQRNATIEGYEEALFYSGSQYYGKDLHNHAPFAENQNNIPTIPTRFYKTDSYTQKEDFIDRSGDYHIPKPILLNPIDPNGTPTFLTHQGGCASEHVLTNISRSYEYDVNGDTIPSNPWVDTEITRSVIIPRREPVGDISHGAGPVISNYSNAIFVGTTIYGYEQSDIFPGPGPDFSYIKLDKAVIFNSDDDTFFTQQINKKGEDVVFQKLLQTTFPWASEFKIKLLDYEHSNNLETNYNVHWNKGYFSRIATYTTESSNYSPQGHFPGTGLNFGNDGRFDSAYHVDNNPYGGNDNTFFQTPRDFLEDGIWTETPKGAEGYEIHMREGLYGVNDRTTGKGGGFYYIPSNNGGGEASTLMGGFKAAGMGMGENQTTFPEHPSPIGAGNFQTGPGYAQYLGMDPFPGGMRFYNSTFIPIGRPIYGMSQFDNGNSSKNLSSTHMSGRMLSGTFTINKQNPSTRWWFEQGGQSNIFWASESMAGDTTASMKTFLNECYEREDLHILTFNEAKEADQNFTATFDWFKKSQHKTTPGEDGVPSFPGDINFIDTVTPANNTVAYTAVAGDQYGKSPGDINYIDSTPENNTVSYTALANDLNGKALNEVYLTNPYGNADVYATNPYGNANPGDDSYSYLLFEPFLKPFTTFGSCLFSDYKKVGLKGAHSRPDHNIAVNSYNYSQEAVFNSTVIAATESISGQKWDVDTYGPRPSPEITSGSGPVGRIEMWGINAPRFLNGSPFLAFGDAVDHKDAPTGIAGNSNGLDAPNPDRLYGRVSVWTNYWYGFNWTHWRQQGTGKMMNYQKKKGWPSLDNWTISKEEKRPNFILTNLNKFKQLPNGEGTKGFILIPDNLNPRIKANLDFYLSKAGLINKEIAPKYKDKTIKKGAYLPSKIKIKRKWYGFGRRQK